MTFPPFHRLATAVVSSLAAFASPAVAADGAAVPITIHRPAPKGPRELTFDSLQDVFPAGSTKLVNGSLIVDLSAWSALLIARLDAGGYCTATLIGPRVLLTAAHCVDAGFGDKGATILGRANIAGSQYALKSCMMHPRYAAAERMSEDVPRTSEDYALCELDGAPPIAAESIVDTPLLGLGSQVLMSGYGCTAIRVAGGALAYDTSDQPGSERLRMGDAKAEAVMVRDYTGAPGSYLRSRSVRSEPVLCPGDSGGPLITGASLAQQTGPLRRVVGVNSMVSAVPRDGRYDYLSFMALLGTEAFRNFAGAWTAQNPSARRVCGRDLLPGQANCRA